LDVIQETRDFAVDVVKGLAWHREQVKLVLLFIFKTIEMEERLSWFRYFLGYQAETQGMRA